MAITGSKCTRRLSRTYLTSTRPDTTGYIKTNPINYDKRYLSPHTIPLKRPIGSITVITMPRALTLQHIEGAKPGKVYYPSEQRFLNHIHLLT